MITVSMVEAEKRLDELIDLVELEDEVVTIAVGPNPRAVMISPQHYESMIRGLRAACAEPAAPRSSDA